MESTRIPDDGGLDLPEDRTSERSRLDGTAFHQRERQAYGGAIQWEAAFFGWLAAVGLAAILVAMAAGAGVAIGITDITETAGRQAKELSLGGGALLVGILALSYLAGGYVAGRMARFDGWRQGLGVWLLALLMTAALAATAWLANGDVNPLQALELPRIPVDEGSGLTRGGAIAVAATAVLTLAAAIAGGVAGESFHRAVDEAGFELEERDA
ncbi:MAG: hypothetical protein M3M99_07140 [Actinomycetota bacterium]|nr:hypothetical protein [Actinomycetota bacterium]